MHTPLLLIHFNRPDITKQAIEALKPVAPRQVWILCDAARTHKPGEAEKVTQVRAQLETLPWPCEIRRLYREENLGCFRNISDGISWFLEDCGGEGIILEDDCIADPSFFPFCTELLERYRNDPSVYAISGHNRSLVALSNESDYIFSNYFECWGWATWQRAWDKFDSEMMGWRDRSHWNAICKNTLRSLRTRTYWNMMFHKVDSGSRDSWAYRYLLSIWKSRGKTAIASINLTENIGFNDQGTHAKASNDTRVKASHIGLPLRHPQSEVISTHADTWLEDNFHSKSFINRLKWFIRQIKS